MMENMEHTFHLPAVPTSLVLRSNITACIVVTVLAIAPFFIKIKSTMDVLAFPVASDRLRVTIPNSNGETYKDATLKLNQYEMASLGIIHVAKSGAVYDNATNMMVLEYSVESNGTARIRSAIHGTLVGEEKNLIELFMNK